MKMNRHIFVEKRLFCSPGSAIEPHGLGAKWKDGDSLLGATSPRQLFRFSVKGAKFQRYRKSKNQRHSCGRGPLRATRSHPWGYVFSSAFHRIRHQRKRGVHQQEFHHQWVDQITRALRYASVPRDYKLFRCDDFLTKRPTTVSRIDSTFLLSL